MELVFFQIGVGYFYLSDTRKHFQCFLNLVGSRDSGKILTCAHIGYLQGKLLHVGGILCPRTATGHDDKQEQPTKKRCLHSSTP